MAGPMQRSKPVEMVEGPALQPASALLDWLQKNTKNAAGGRRRVRLPVVVRFTDQHRLELGSAFVGVAPGAPPADALSLALDDGGLGVAVVDTLRERCPKGQDGCAIWLEGYFGELVPMPQAAPAQAGPQAWPFAVLRVDGLVEANAPGKIKVEG